MRKFSLSVLTSTLVIASAAVALAVTEEHLDADVRDAIQLFQRSDTKMQPLFDTAHGYAVFPSVGKGAIGIGGAEGRGEVFERGKLIGTAKLTQVTVGVQLGGQSYAEVIFFETPKALNEFKDGKFALSAGLSAVAAAEGKSANAKYQHGVLVFTVPNNGLMFEASVGGQKFTFTPLAANPPETRSAPAQAPPAQKPTPAPVP